MWDPSLKMIKDLNRYDQVIQDIHTNKISIISDIKESYNNNIVKISTNTLTNYKDLYILGNHLIWVSNDKNRILAKNIECIEIQKQGTQVYSIQFDKEGTFYANGLKIDNLSPYHCKYPLEYEKFIDKNKYIKNRLVKNEDDKFRNKPTMIDKLVK